MMGETASSVPNPCYVVASPHGRVQCGLPVLRVTVSPNRVSTHPDQERPTLFPLTAPRNYALKGSYRAVDQSVKLTPDRPTHAGLSNSEHSARQPKTWKAAALPTELLPPGKRVAMIVEGRWRGLLRSGRRSSGQEWCGPNGLEVVGAVRPGRLLVGIGLDLLAMDLATPRVPGIAGRLDMLLELL